jgi:mono/diheme cytochrome c family protein
MVSQEVSVKRISALIGLLLLVHSSSITPSSANKSKTTQKPTSNVARGKALFLANGCMDCHSINGQGCTEGVSLSSVGLRRDADFLKQQLIDPDKHVEKNKKAFNSEPNLMTNPDLSPKEVDLIVTYLQTLKKPVPKKGEKSKDYNSL